MKGTFFGDNSINKEQQNKEKGGEVFDAVQRLNGAKFALTGAIGRAVNFVKTEQLKDRALWSKFVHQFRIRKDSEDTGWRGEFWGKMMRGACVVYAYDNESELYGILEETVKDILSTQDEYGRISSYTPEKEFFGWDVWCRKYVMLGLEYFYDICQDETFKGEILRSLCRQADYIVEKIGEGEGKISVTDTSSAWGCVNSCSVLEAMIWIYKNTHEKKYLDFVNYLIGTGGCKDGNLLETALECVRKPHEFPSRKAYEVTSFFNGVLDTYRVTGNPKYLKAVENYAKLVKENDLTIIGCCGCDEEMFDNSALTQTEFKRIMQETCVTVTWLQLCYGLLCVTGDVSYANLIECSAYNALYSSINYSKNKEIYFIPDQVEKIPLPFDSYSPLVDNRRGIVPGGYRLLYDDTYYGCCASIGSLGVGLVPLMGVMTDKDGFVFHLYENGTVDTLWQGERVRFRMQTSYPQGDNVKIIVETDGKPIDLEIKLRIPQWSEKTECFVDGAKISEKENGYFRLRGVFKTGDEITLTYLSKVEIIELNGKIAVQKGAIVMARDERFGEQIDERVCLQTNGGEVVVEHVDKTPFEANETLAITCENGRVIHLCDYASAGTDWKNEKNKITVWMNR